MTVTDSKPETEIPFDDLTDREWTSALADLGSAAPAAAEHTTQQTGDPAVLARRRQLLVEAAAAAWDTQVAHDLG